MFELAPRRADSVEIDELVAAFNAAFAGYLVPMSHTVATLGAMIATNDVRLSHSFLLRATDGQWAGVALLGVRESAGWVAGMAVAPPWRRRGIGERLMRLALAEARSVGVRRVQLEVLDENAAALALYTRLGFVSLRPLAVYMGALTWPSSGRSADQPRDRDVVRVSRDEALAHFAAFHQVAPPWQRDLPSLRQSTNRLLGLGLRDTSGLRAYALYASSAQGPAVLDFGSRAASSQERMTDAQRLLAAILRETPGSTVRVINVPPGDAIGEALESLSCPMVNRQTEMALTLPSPRAE